jgi:hypothetical protein
VSVQVEDPLSVLVHRVAEEERLEDRHELLMKLIDERDYLVHRGTLGPVALVVVAGVWYETVVRRHLVGREAEHSRVPDRERLLAELAPG